CHAELTIELGNHYFDLIGARDRVLLADDVGVNGQLAASAVDEDAEENPPRTSEIGKLVERCADRPAGEENVVHDGHDAVCDSTDVQPRFTHDRPRPDGHQVIAIQRDVERTGGHLHPFGLL